MTSMPKRLDGVAPAGDAEGPPFFGALLRLALQHARVEINDAIRAAGFTDLQEAHYAVFSYPPPDGIRPSELARRLGMSRQATNHLLAQMEALGYLERRAPDGGERRLVHLTERGWKVGEAIHAHLRARQAQWAAEVGPERFAVFMDVLRHMAGQGVGGESRDEV